MEQNIGSSDSVIRILLALGFVYLGLLYSAWWYVISIILVITVFTGHCWIYRLFGFSTLKKKSANKKPKKKVNKKKSKKKRK